MKTNKINNKLGTKNIFLMITLMLVIVGSLELVIGVETETEFTEKEWLEEMNALYIQSLGENPENSVNEFNDKWKSSTQKQKEEFARLFKKAELIEKSVWDVFNTDEYKQEFFSLLDEESRINLWDSQLKSYVTIVGQDRFEDSPLTNPYAFPDYEEATKNRQDLLDSLTLKQQDEMLRLIARENNPTLEKVDFSQGITDGATLEYQIDANGERVVITDRYSGIHIIPLSNLPKTLTGFEIKPGKGSGEMSVFATYENNGKKNEVILRGGHSIKRR